MKDGVEKKILVIDDEVYIRDSVIGFLEDFGFDVIEAENGRQGLEKFEAEKPDLILCDLRMPEMDGLEVLENVARIDRSIPIIIVSGAGNIADTVEALRLGAWDYIIKPVQDMNVLYHAVDSVPRQDLFHDKKFHRIHSITHGISQDRYRRYHRFFETGPGRPARALLQSFE